MVYTVLDPPLSAAWHLCVERYPAVHLRQSIGYELPPAVMPAPILTLCAPFASYRVKDGAFMYGTNVSWPPYRLFMVSGCSWTACMWRARVLSGCL